MIATDDKNIGTSGDEFNDSTAKYVLGKPLVLRSG